MNIKDDLVKVSPQSEKYFGGYSYLCTYNLHCLTEVLLNKIDRPEKFDFSYYKSLLLKNHIRYKQTVFA